MITLQHAQILVYPAGTFPRNKPSYVFAVKEVASQRTYTLEAESEYDRYFPT